MIKILKRYQYVLFSIALIGMVIACQQDEDILEKEDQQNDVSFPELSGRLISVKELLDDKDIARRVNALASSNNSIGESGAGITIDTTHIEMMTSTAFTNYTFQIVQDSIEKQQVLRNYMITIVNDTTLLQHLISYDVMNDGSYDMDNISMEQVWGDDLISQTSMECGDSTIEWYQKEDCYSWTCSPPSGNGEHEVGEECNANPADRAGSVCVTSWASIVIQEDPCASSGGNPTGPVGDPGGTLPVDGVPPNGPGNNQPPNDPGNDNDDDDKVTIGLYPNDGVADELPSDPECDFLKKLTDDPVISGRIRDLKTSAETNSYEEIHEYIDKLDISGDELTFHENRGTNNDPAAPLSDLTNYYGRMITMHTHYAGSIDTGTISMYSYEDLLVFLQDT